MEFGDQGGVGHSSLHWRVALAGGWFDPSRTSLPLSYALSHIPGQNKTGSRAEASTWAGVDLNPSMVLYQSTPRFSLFLFSEVTSRQPTRNLALGFTLEVL